MAFSPMLRRVTGRGIEAACGNRKAGCSRLTGEMSRAIFALALLISSTAFAAEKYTGPRPPKADVVYLVHADNLVETELGKAKSDERKDVVVATLPGRQFSG